MHSGGRYFVVAGVAIMKHRILTRDQLSQAERVSSKGKQDWKGTKNLQRRIRYIETVVKIPELTGAFFYACYENNERKYWEYTVDAIRLAILRFGQDRHCIVRHQGFNYRTREKLREALAELDYSFEIQTGSTKSVEVRLADGICGYLGLMLFNGDSQQASYYCAVPESFVNLKNEAPD